jgi:hypothetical protein
MVSGGNTRQQAEQEFETLLRVLGLFSHGSVSWTAEPKNMHVDVAVDFSKPQKSSEK